MLKTQNYKNYHLMVSLSFFLSIFLFLYGCKLKNGTENGDNTPPASGGWLYTKGNKIYTPDGQVWQGRGANLQDTRGCNACTWSPPNTAEIKRRIDELVDVWGADFIRLTMESYGTSGGRTHWQGIRLDREYLDDIIEIADYIKTKPGVYVLLSLWSDPGFSQLGWPTDNTIETWETLAEIFKNHGHVLYGIVNEPQSNWNGSLDGDCWEAMNRTVEAIRAVENMFGTPAHIIAVQGTRMWARRLDYYINNPITAGGGENIVYETHVYDPEPDFSLLFGNPSRTLPVIIGEFGPVPGYMTEDDCIILMQQADSLDIPFLAWTFHMRCPPNLLMDYSNGGCGVDMKLEPTSWGRILKDHLISY
jgi:endoglucanase